MEDILTHALEGNGIAIEIIREIGRYIGIATANILNLLNPDTVIFGGEYSRLREIIGEAIRDTVRSRAWPVVKNTEITFTDFGIDADLRGAATLAIRKFLEIGYEYIV